MPTSGQEQPFTLDSISCRLHFFGALLPQASTPLFVMPVSGDVSELMEGQHMRLDPAVRQGALRPFVLATFVAPDWENGLSPWPAPALRRGRPDFAGNAGTTLDWVLRRLLPVAAQRVPQTAGGAHGLLGYSMAGLFALWAVHQTDAFSVCASCSGSLWYEGFDAYLERTPLQSPCAIYLSLGEAEEKARSPVFARVGDATRRIAALLARSPAATDTALVWHPGGHTGAVGERLAAALMWMGRHS